MSPAVVMVTGRNDNHQLGLGDTELRKRFEAVESLADLPVEMVACTWKSSYAVLRDGTVMVSGFNGSGQLGMNALDRVITTFTPCKSLSSINITQVTGIGGGGALCSNACGWHMWLKTPVGEASGEGGAGGAGGRALGGGKADRKGSKKGSAESAAASKPAPPPRRATPEVPRSSIVIPDSSSASSSELSSLSDSDDEGALHSPSPSPTFSKAKSPVVKGAMSPSAASAGKAASGKAPAGGRFKR